MEEAAAAAVEDDAEAAARVRGRGALQCDG